MNEIEDVELLRLKTRQTNLTVELGDQIRDLTLQQRQAFLVGEERLHTLLNEYVKELFR